MVGRDAGVAALEQQQVLHHQPGADEQREGDGDLGDDQAVAERRAAAAAGARVPFAQRRGQRLQPQAQQRRQAADQADQRSTMTAVNASDAAVDRESSPRAAGCWRRARRTRARSRSRAAGRARRRRARAAATRTSAGGRRPAARRRARAGPRSRAAATGRTPAAGWRRWRRRSAARRAPRPSAPAADRGSSRRRPRGSERTSMPWLWPNSFASDLRRARASPAWRDRAARRASSRA